MARYRLMTGTGVELASFEADGAEAAVTRGREIAGRRQLPPAHHMQAGAGLHSYTVERQEGNRWWLVHSWVPTPRTTF